MPSALIGHTGFVGSNLLRQAHFKGATTQQTSATLQAGRLISWFAGVRAEKWLANAKPEDDWQRIVHLVESLATIRTRELILISTVDVFAQPQERRRGFAGILDGLHAYGTHRFMLERLLAERFPTRIVRLPGLFGPGLKKNVIFDLLHGNQTLKIHSESVFQFYDLNRLWDDGGLAPRQADLSLVQLATAPVSVAELAREAFGSSLRTTRARPRPLRRSHPTSCGVRRRERLCPQPTRSA